MPARAARRAAVLVVALALAGCTGPGGDDRAQPSASAASPAPSASPSPSRSAAPAPVATPTVERAAVDAGTVAEGVAATASGDGPARVSVVRDGEFGVVAHLDCSACTGDVVLTADGRTSPWGAGPAPLTGTYLVDLLQGTAAEQEVVLDAQGPWTLTFRSWNDLPVVTGEQRGRGAAVFVLGDAASGARIDYEPAGPDDAMLARVVSGVDVDPVTGPASLVLGDEQAFSETAEVALPGVVALSTNGTWTVTPVP